MSKSGIQTTNGMLDFGGGASASVEVDGVTIQKNSDDELETVTKTFVGTSAEWAAVTDKSFYDIVNITDDGSTVTDIQTALNMLYPNTWQANTEIDFGNGLYGIRATGTITEEANTEKYIRLVTGVTGIVSCGGCVKTHADSTFVVGTSNSTYGFSTIYFDNTSKLYLLSTAAVQRTDAPYDVWVLYTKA